MSKITKIEISDFRGFDSVRSFDFEDAEVVIFLGMNGFGKTSIFDAVEWCLTGHVSRYESYLATGRKQDFSKEKKVLRNKYATDPHTLVKVELGNGEKFGRRVTVADNGCDYGTGSIIDGYNYGLDKIANQVIDPEVIHHYFSATHILSQETIHHFVTSKKPEDRYRALSVNFGTSLYEPFDDNAQRLTAELKSREESLHTKLRESNIRIGDFRGQLKTKLEDITTTILDANKIIIVLRGLSGEIQLQEFTFDAETSRIKGVTKQEVQKVLLTMQMQMEELNTRHSLLRSVMADLQKWQSENKKLGNLDKAVLENKKHSEAIKSSQEKCALIAKEIEQISTSLNREVEEKNLADIIKISFPKFYQDASMIETLRKEIDTRNKVSQSQNDKLLSIVESFLESQSHIEKLENFLLEIQKLDSEINPLVATSEQAHLEKTKLNNINQLIKKHSANLDDLRKLQSEIEKTWPTLKAEQLGRISVLAPAFGEEYFNKINQKIKEVKNKDIELEELSEKQRKATAEYEALARQLGKSQSLLTQALDLIPSSGETPCPVCEVSHQAESLHQLINLRVASSKTIAVQELTKKQSLLDELMAKARREKEDASGYIILGKSTILEALTAEITVEVTHLSNARADEEAINFIQRKAQTANDEVVRKAGQLLGQKPSGIVDAKILLEKKREDITSSLQGAKVLLLTKREQKAEIEKNIELNVQSNKVAAERILALENADYEKVRNFLVGKGISINTLAEHKLSAYVDAREALCIEYRGRLKELESNKAVAFTALQNLTESASLEKLKIDMLKFTEEITEINRFLAEFKERCIRLDFDLAKLTAENLTNEVTKTEGRHDHNSKCIQSLMELVDKTKELTDFSKEDPIRKSIKAFEDEAQAIEVNLSKTETARKTIEELKKKFPRLLEQYIKDNLDVDLFNQIYRSLNPHRRFKEIDFKVEVSHNKVGLNFNATHSNLNARPEFLFSSAQLNTFGVSMFLSMALRQSWLNFDTVLLDDPIQNLDDINVLSLIDLIRGLLDLNKGKQVILSTHDERFYNLVKRKFAGYKLKAYRFESYGRVAPDQV